MKNSKKWLTAAAVLTLSSTLAFAGPHGGKGGGRHGRGHGAQFGEKFAAKLNLSEGQKLQIQEAQKSFREQNKAFFDSARETRRQLREAKEAGDTARLEQLKATAKSQRAQMKTLGEAQTQRIVALLTPEQRTQWDAMKAEREARRGNKDRGERF